VPVLQNPAAGNIVLSEKGENLITMKDWRINSTHEHYLIQPIDLLNEQTICECFAHIGSPYMVAMEEPRSYGEIIGNLLSENALLPFGTAVCEIGGGYGSLMRGLLESYGDRVRHVLMVDLSSSLMKRQCRILKNWEEKISFVKGDAREIIRAFRTIDVIICNEVAGDLETWTGLDPANLPEAVKEKVDRYELSIPSRGEFNFNMGAIDIVEKICKIGAKAFIAEHSSDPIIPEEMAFLARDLVLDGYPREIRLKGHSEYTIRFEHLVKTANCCGRKVRTGSLADLAGLQNKARMRSIFVGRMAGSEEHEILYELLDHIREYRWMLIL
jgi:hypothetical protein